MSNEYNHLCQQVSSLSARVDQLSSQIAQMSRPPIRDVYRDSLLPLTDNEASQALMSRAGSWAKGGPVNTAETGKRIPMAFSDPEMQRAYDAGEPFKTPDERRIQELEAIIERGGKPVAVVLSVGSREGDLAPSVISANAMGNGIIMPGDHLYAAPPSTYPQQRRIESLERALAGMLFEFDDGVNGGHRESPDEHVAALDYARTLVKAEEFKA